MILDVNGSINTNFVLKSAINSLEQKYPKNFSLIGLISYRIRFIKVSCLKTLSTFKTLFEQSDATFSVDNACNHH